jgi:hypothetical protein
MTIPLFRNGEALYTIIFKDTNAKNLLQKWLSSNRYAQARVDNNKLHIYDHNTYNLFFVTWRNNWDNILIWDCYIKRHIYI